VIGLPTAHGDWEEPDDENEDFFDYESDGDETNSERRTSRVMAFQCISPDRPEPHHLEPHHRWMQQKLLEMVHKAMNFSDAQDPYES
jgi:hypothetical protein